MSPFKSACPVPQHGVIPAPPHCHSRESGNPVFVTLSLPPRGEAQRSRTGLAPNKSNPTHPAQPLSSWTRSRTSTSCIKNRRASIHKAPNIFTTIFPFNHPPSQKLKSRIPTVIPAKAPNPVFVTLSLPPRGEAQRSRTGLAPNKSNPTHRKFILNKALPIYALLNSSPALLQPNPDEAQHRVVQSTNNQHEGFCPELRRSGG